MKIAGRTWYDLGSDVCWEDYGGVWGRPADPKNPDGLWYVLRYDEGGDDERPYGPSVTVYEITPGEVSDAALRWWDYPFDGRGDYDNPIDPMVLRTWRVQAAVAYGEGMVEQVSAPFGCKLAARLRATAARYAMGDYIPEHPFRWSPL